MVPKPACTPPDWGPEQRRSNSQQTGQDQMPSTEDGDKVTICRPSRASARASASPPVAPSCGKSTKYHCRGSAARTPCSASNASADAASRPSGESAPWHASVIRAAVTNPLGSASRPAWDIASPSCTASPPGRVNTASSRWRMNRSGRYPYRKSDGVQSSFHVALIVSVSSARVTATSRFFFSLDSTAARRASQ